MAAVLQDKPPRYYTCFFTDDSYFFFRACPEESAHITRCLRRYEEASGQKINKEKLTISFSPNVPENKKLKKNRVVYHSRGDRIKSGGQIPGNVGYSREKQKGNFLVYKG